MHDAPGHSDPDDHGLQLMDNEAKLIKHAKKYFDKVIVLINSSNILQIPELAEPQDRRITTASTPSFGWAA